MQAIRKARHANRHERLVYLLAGFGGLLDFLVTLASLTYFVSDIRARILFSDWAMQE